MKAKFIKIFKLFEELEEAGECATLTISSKGGTSSIKLLLESPPSLPTTASLPTTLPPVSGKRVAVTVVQLQGPVADRELLTTKPASWRGVHLFLLLLLQEKPVIQLDPLSISILHLHPHQAVGLSHPWVGRLQHLLAVLNWMDHLLHHRFSCHCIKHLGAQEH